MISNELHNARVCETFRIQLSDFKFKCTSSLEKECLNIIDQLINSKIQFIPSNLRSESFKKSFMDTFENLFETRAATLCNLNDIMGSWTFNFESDDNLFLQRIRQFVSLLLRTKEMDQFLRAYKIFFVNNSKKQYNALLDELLKKYNIQVGQYMNSGNASPNAPEKKTIFKHLKSIDDQRNALIVLVLIFSSLFKSLESITNQIRDSAKDWYRSQVELRKTPEEK